MQMLLVNHVTLWFPVIIIIIIIIIKIVKSDTIQLLYLDSISISYILIFINYLSTYSCYNLLQL